MDKQIMDIRTDGVIDDVAMLDKEQVNLLPDDWKWTPRRVARKLANGSIDIMDQRFDFKNKTYDREVAKCRLSKYSIRKLYEMIK